MLVGLVGLGVPHIARQKLITQRCPPSLLADATANSPFSPSRHLAGRLMPLRDCSEYDTRTRRSTLNFGEDVRMMLLRFLVSDKPDPALLPRMLRLIAGSGEATSKVAADGSNALTERGRRVLALVAPDQSNKKPRTIAISTETMKTHLKNIFAKLDVQQRGQAPELARSLGLLDQQLRRLLSVSPFRRGGEALEEHVRLLDGFGRCPQNPFSRLDPA